MTLKIVDSEGNEGFAKINVVITETMKLSLRDSVSGKIFNSIVTDEPAVSGKDYSIALPFMTPDKSHLIFKRQIL
ncbi:hypothetical protein [Vagococcus silagei]